MSILSHVQEISFSGADHELEVDVAGGERENSFVPRTRAIDTMLE